MPILQIFTEDNEATWKKTLKNFPINQQDIYYTPEYYKSWKNHEGAEIQCLYYKQNEFEILYPFFRKEITGYSLAKKHYDIYNAYGYGGLITNKGKDCPEEITQSFNKLSDEYLRDTGVVSEFIRENPIISSPKRNAERQVVRRNVYIDTHKEYILPCKNVRENYQKALNKELHIEIDEHCERMDEFIRLYRITAARLDMQHYYHFNDEYFYGIRQLLKGNIKLLFVVKGEIVIAGLIMLYYGNHAVLHLSASDFRFQTCRLNDFLFVSGIREAVTMKMHTLNLGGGTGNDDHDGLFRFKRKFGNKTREVYIGKKIHNAQVYHQLERDWENRYPHLIKHYGHYLQKHLFTRIH